MIAYFLSTAVFLPIIQPKTQPSSNVKINKSLTLQLLT